MLSTEDTCDFLPRVSMHDQEKLERGFTGCHSCRLEVHSKENGSWSVSDSSVSEAEAKIQSSQSLHILFASAGEIRECLACRTCFSDLLNLPESFWSTPYRRSNGYFGWSETYSDADDSTAESYSSFFRFIVKEVLDESVEGKKDYSWSKMNMVTRWWPSGRQVIVCFDVYPDLRTKFPKPMLDGAETQGPDPFWIHQWLLEELLVLHDKSVWSVRTRIRRLEMIRTAPSSQPDPDYHSLHDLVRHAAHSTETLDVAIKTMEAIILQHSIFANENSLHTGKDKQMRNKLRFQLQMLSSLQCRSVANMQRLQNEITLAFNTVSQYDTKVSVQIARATKNDSAAMRTIAFLTMFFLPPTFICSIFSMSFFNFNPGEEGTPPKWAVSEMWWLYLVTAAPITIMTVIGVGFLWKKSMADEQTSRKPIVKYDHVV